MLQRVSLGRWTQGEASQKSIGDYDLESYPYTARYVNNFLVNSQAKITRRPGFVMQDTVTEKPGRLVPYIIAGVTYLVHFYIDGVELRFKIYSMQDTPFGRRLSASAESVLVYTYTEDDFNQHPIPGVAIDGSPFILAAIPDEDTLTAHLKLLSYVQVREHMYITQRYMKFPVHIFYDETGEYGPTQGDAGWVALNYLEEHDNESTPAYVTNYVDVWWDSTEDPGRWRKTVTPNLNEGAEGLGYMPYTGNKPINRYDEVPKTMEYFVSVTFIYNRIVLVRENIVHCTTNGDETQVGWQLRPEVASYSYEDADELPPELLISDAFNNQIGSDLGQEELYWASSGKALFGGANNGIWVLSNNQAGGLNAINPLMYKALSEAAHFVPGKSIGDAFVYFQKPGNTLKELSFTDRTMGYQSKILNYFADHLFENSKPVEMVVQRSPYNIAWILNDTGQLSAMTYDQALEINGWARISFGTKYTGNENEGGTVSTIAVYSDGEIDRLAAIVNRDGTNYMELMDVTVDYREDVLFLDSSSRLELQRTQVTLIDREPTKEIKIHCENALDVGDHVRFEGFELDDYSVESFIYGIWEITQVDPTYIMVKDTYNIGYNGTMTYKTLGEVVKVYKDMPISLLPYLPSLPGKHIKCVMDKIPYDIMMNSQGVILDTTVEVESGQDYPELGIWWNSIDLGFGYESIFSPYILKKQIYRGKINEMELEIYKSMGGKIGVADITWDYKIDIKRIVDITYPITYDKGQAFTGTVKPAIVGGYSDDPLWFIYVSDGVPFNLSSVIFYLEAN